MEQIFKKHTSQYKFIDCYKESPLKMDASYKQKSNCKPTSKHKSDKLYTQFSSSSRANNKVSVSNHQSPTKSKHQKLLKTSVLNYLHKCRSEYQDTSTMFTHTKSTSKNMKNIVCQQQKTSHSAKAQKIVHNELLDRTSDLLNGYKKQCYQLQKQKQKYKLQLQQARAKIKQLQKSIKKYKRKSMEESK